MTRGRDKYQPPEPKRGVYVSIDLRLTQADLTRLDAGQVKALFEGVGRLAANESA